MVARGLRKLEDIPIGTKLIIDPDTAIKGNALKRVLADNITLLCLGPNSEVKVQAGDSQSVICFDCDNGNSKKVENGEIINNISNDRWLFVMIVELK